LNDWNSNKHYTEKYGEIPVVTVRGRRAAAFSGQSATISDTAVTVIGYPAEVTFVAKETQKRIADVRAGNAPAAVVVEADTVVFKPGFATSLLEVVIDRNTTKDDISKMDKQFRQHGYMLFIQEFNVVDGHLKSIKGFIGSTDGKSTATFNSDNLGNDHIKLRVQQDRKGERLLSVNAR
jgi:hypothetical protein